MVFFLSIFIIILDQVTKTAAINHLKGGPPYVIIDNLFQLYYVENKGAAFGILQERRTFFIIITLIILVLISLFIIKNYHELNRLSKFALAILLGGAAGNLIDRIRFGYVVDFLSVKLMNGYNFPVFNIADMFIVSGTIILVGLILFDKFEV